MNVSVAAIIFLALAVLVQEISINLMRKTINIQNRRLSKLFNDVQTLEKKVSKLGSTGKD